ncbi:MAG: hypothetical protein J6K20_14065 [Thermoguttaceae bacterium]|nr:hypothetical protein [Thermoguttaceae bacterium]
MITRKRPTARTVSPSRGASEKDAPPYLFIITEFPILGTRKILWIGRKMRILPIFLKVWRFYRLSRC